MSYPIGHTVEIPSPIDVHMHLREPGGEDMETIATGTYAALMGGYQAVFDMPNNPNGHQTWSMDRLQEKYLLGSRTSETHIGFYAGVDLSNPALVELTRMVSKAAGLKIYMGETTGNTTVYDLDTARASIDTWIDYASLKGGAKPPILLHARNEIGAETADYIARRNFPVHWCHIASAIEIDYVDQLNRIHPELFTAGVTPHHLLMTSRDADFKYGWHGGRMQPPLADQPDADKLLNAYNKGILKILETDHAPHTETAKMDAEAQNPRGETAADCTTCYGISGVEFVLPVMASLVQRDIITLERLVDSLHTQPARMLQLDVANNTKKTKLIFEPRVLRAEDWHSKSGNHPYLGWTVWARVVPPKIGTYAARTITAGSAL